MRHLYCLTTRHFAYSLSFDNNNSNPDVSQSFGDKPTVLHVVRALLLATAAEPYNYQFI